MGEGRSEPEAALPYLKRVKQYVKCLESKKMLI